MINGNILGVTLGTAKTYEHLSHGFEFKVVGDGAVEKQLIDSFSPRDPIVENISQRSLRDFIAAEQGLLQEKTAPVSAEAGREALAKLAQSHLGDGWEVLQYYDFSPSKPGPDRTVVGFRGQNSSQQIDIEHRDQNIELQTRSLVDEAWQISHNLRTGLKDGEIDASQVVEGAHFSRG